MRWRSIAAAKLHASACTAISARRWASQACTPTRTHRHTQAVGIIRRQSCRLMSHTPTLPSTQSCQPDAAPPLAGVCSYINDVDVSDAVDAFICASDTHVRARTAEALGRLEPAALEAVLMRCAACSTHAVALGFALRDVCAAREHRHAEWARNLDRACVHVLRTLCSPAFVHEHQLALGPTDGEVSNLPEWMPTLVQRAEMSESVHKTSDETAFRRKFGPRRLVFASTHDARPADLLAVLYVAILPGMPASMSQIDAMSGGEPDRRRGRWALADGFAVATPGGAATRSARELHGIDALPATTAAFYSVSTPHDGVRGLRLGTRIIYNVAQRIANAAPAISTFCTLSPIPGFVDWVRTTSTANKLSALLNNEQDRLAVSAAVLELGGSAPSVAPPELTAEQASMELSNILTNASPAWYGNKRVRSMLRPVLDRLVRHYLLLPTGRSGHPTCKVAGFHLSNGARMQRICWGADESPAGIDRSASLMVNYLYSETGLDGLRDTMRMHASAFAQDPGAVLAAQRPV